MDTVQANQTGYSSSVMKIADDEIFYDFQLNTTQSDVVGTEEDEVLKKIQRGFESI